MHHVREGAPAGSGRELPQHVVEDAAATVILHLVHGIDPAQRSETVAAAVGAGDFHDHLLPRFEAVEPADREGIIAAEAERGARLAYAELQAKCSRIKGAYLHGLGGTDTHVHLALSIEPFVTISDLVQELKGASSFEVNRRMDGKALEWQRGYGVVSFGKSNLDWLLDYVRRQREHHANGQLQGRLEACDSPDDSAASPAEAG
jgi:putative transposase